MDFFQRLKNVFTGGTFESDDERRRREQAANVQAVSRASQAPAAPRQQLMGPSYSGYSQAPSQGPMLGDQQQEQTKAIRLNIPGQQEQPPKKAKPAVAPAPSELDQLAAAKLPQARREAQVGQNWLEKTLLNAGDNERRAVVDARNQATSEIRQRTPEVVAPDVKAYGEQTDRLASHNSRQAATAVRQTDTMADNMTKVAQVAQYVPVLGSTINLGLAGSQALGKLVGDTQFEQDMQRTRNKVDFNLDQNQYDQLDKTTRDKLEVLRNIGLGVSPLDFLGATGFAKATGLQAAKDAAVQTIKNGAIDAATKQVLKTEALSTAKNLAVPTLIGTGLSAGAQGYLSGKVDPLEAVKTGLMGGFTSLLFSGPGKAAAKEMAVKGAPTEIAPGIHSFSSTRGLPEPAPAPVAPAVDPNFTPLHGNGIDPTPAPQSVDVNAPAFLRKAADNPTSVELQQAADRPIPDALFNADARQYDMPDPLDVPTFQRRAADANITDATTRMSQAEADIAAYRQMEAELAAANDQIQALSDQRRSAALDFAQPQNARVAKAQDLINSSLKNKAVAQTEQPLTDALTRGETLLRGTQDETRLRDAIVARSQAQKDLDAAQRAKAAQEAVLAEPAPAKAPAPAKIAPVTETTTPAPAKIAPVTETTTPAPAKIAPVTETTTPAPAKIAPVTETTTPVASPVKIVEAPIKTAGPVPKIPEFGPAPAEPAPVKAAAVAADAGNPVKPAKTPKPTKTIAQDNLPKIIGSDSAGTGEMRRSKGKFARGQQYEAASNETNKARGAEAAKTTSYDDFIKQIEDKGGMDGADRDTANALKDRFEQSSPEYRTLTNLVNKFHTEAGQTLGTADRTIRRTANPKQLTDRFATKLYAHIDDNKTVSQADFDKVMAKNQAYTDARDAHNKAIDTFNGDPSEANLQAVFESYAAAEKADKAAKFAEYKVAAAATKGSKNEKAKAYAKQLEADAGVYMMDWVDSSMLSSVKTMLNNFVNTLSVRAEEQLFGKAGAAAARLLTRADVGGGSTTGARLGAKLGDMRLVDDAKLRANSNGNGLIKVIKNYTTTGNTLGERNIYATAYAGLYDEVKASLRKQGYRGTELKRRALVGTLTAEPEKIDKYMGQALETNAMSSITQIEKQGTKQKIESFLIDALGRRLEGVPGGQVVAKGVTRVAVGFPTVIVRTAEQGGRRAVFGGASWVQAAANAIRKGDPEVTAKYIKQAVKEGGSGLAMTQLGALLGAQGLISGAYPTDKAEQEQWKREGKSEHAIKIGDSWYSLPSMLGAFSLPLMIGANGGSNQAAGKNYWDNFGTTTWRTLVDSVPVDSAQNLLKFMNDTADGKDGTKVAAQMSASFIRAMLPLGSLFNQAAKMTDSTDNDTSQGDFWAQVLHKVYDGLPVATNTLPDKQVEGQTIENPGPIQTLFGAISKEQGAGVATTEAIKANVADATRRLNEYDAFRDDIGALLDRDTKVLFDQAKGGKELSEDDMKKLLKGMTNGVTATEDTRFLEDGNYDANLAVLKVKRDMLEADPTTRRAELDDYDTQIRRGEVAKTLRTPYSTIKAYRETKLEEWRNMGDPESEDYNPELYQKLWEYDEALAKNNASKNTTSMDKQAYYAKPDKKKGGKGGGRGGRGGSGGGTVGGGKIGSTPSLAKIDLGDLKPEKASSLTKIPTIQQIKPGDLIKKRTISIKKG